MPPGKASEESSNGPGTLGVLLAPASPWKWELDDSGKPKWIPAPAGASWATVFEWDVGFGKILQMSMPAFNRGALGNGNGNGNAHGNGNGNGNGDAATARRAAGLRDLYRCDHDYIVRHVLMPGQRHATTDRKAAKRIIREGREVLHEQGVLPWAVFTPDVVLPKRWWRNDVFLVALREWQVQPVYDMGQSVIGWAARAAAAAAGQVQVQLREAPVRVRRAVLR
jgi:hypothetical protein